MPAVRCARSSPTSEWRTKRMRRPERSSRRNAAERQGIWRRSCGAAKRPPSLQIGMRAVITDFGMAHQADAAPGTVFAAQRGGTPGYMAPELWRGEKATIASDLYALGVILFELIFRRRPHEMVGSLPSAASTRTLLRGPSRPPAAVQPLPSVHPKWDPIVARCLDPDPARRYGSSGEVLQAFAPSRTRLRVLTVAAAALLAAVSGVVTYQRATAPQSTVHLAVLPFQAGPGTSSLGDELARKTADELARIKGSSRTGFAFIPLSTSLCIVAI